jgi:hypothetical protein
VTFTNSILSGETLVRDSIQSEGYVQGSTGWSIERDGDAEFNDVAIRGSLEVSGSGGTLNINVDILGQPEIQFLTSGGDEYRIEADNNSLDIGQLDNFADQTSMHFVENEGLAIRSGNTGAPSALWDVDDGFWKFGSFSPWTVDDWVNVTLLNTFTGTVSYKKLPTGEVIFRGSVGGAAADNAVGRDVFQLPAGYRPLTTVRFETATGAGGAGDTAGRIQINTSGLCEVARVCGGTTSFYFDSVRFSVI